VRRTDCSRKSVSNYMQRPARSTEHTGQQPVADVSMSRSAAGRSAAAGARAAGEQRGSSDRCAHAQGRPQHRSSLRLLWLETAGARTEQACALEALRVALNGRAFLWTACHRGTHGDEGPLRRWHGGRLTLCRTWACVLSR
jgi:hypothetical protein